MRIVYWAVTYCVGQGFVTDEGTAEVGVSAEEESHDLSDAADGGVTEGSVTERGAPSCQDCWHPRRAATLPSDRRSRADSALSGQRGAPI
jgi:hypothetical protein